MDVLQRRRSDLWYIKLNCENADTELPYIDLVNEILESYVADGLLDWRTAKNTPADATTEQLTLSPKNTIESAYDVLSAQVFPTRLPFDLPLETARVYIGALGTSRANLMATFRHNNIPTELAIACEYLKISCDTRVVSISSAQGVALQDFMGIPIELNYIDSAIKFWGVMSHAQLSLLVKLSPDLLYQRAIQALFAMSNARGNGTNQRFSTPLSSLPSNINPPSNPIPIRYASSQNQLIFCGSMNSAQQSVLLTISTDPIYQAAVNSLYQSSQHAGLGSYSVPLPSPPAIPIPPEIPISFADGLATFSGTMAARPAGDPFELVVRRSIHDCDQDIVFDQLTGGVWNVCLCLEQFGDIGPGQSHSVVF